MESIPGKSFGNEIPDSFAQDFDIIEFVKRPLTLVRLLSILFSIIVFGCVAAAGFDSADGTCIFNKDANACHYGVGIGVIAFLGCLLFLAVDISILNITDPERRRQIVMADLGFSGLWAFLWFVGFCYLADQWRKSAIMLSYQTNHARAAIAFSFFSIFTWVTLTAMAWQRYRQGDGFQYNAAEQPGQYQNEFNNAGPPLHAASPYDSFPLPQEGNITPSYQSGPPGL